MRPNLINRLKEEWNNLDPVDPLRGLLFDAIEALAEQPERSYRQLQDNGSKYFGESWDKAEQPAKGCDHCNHALYAGTKCKNCGRVTEQAAIKRDLTPEQPAQQQEPVGKAHLCDRCSTPFDGEDECPECGHGSATKKQVYLAPQPAPVQGWKLALDAAVSALYFDDSSDFRAGLGAVIRHLDPQLAGEMLAHPKAACDKVKALLAEQPAQQQEPVGELTIGGIIDTSDGPEYEDWDIEWNSKAIEALQDRLVTNDPVTLSLYTSPQPAQQQEPLTDEQIKALWESSTGKKLPNMGSSIWQLLAVARAIEAAHGIKENT